MKIQLARETLSPACIGRMSIDGQYFGFTLERPWLNNDPMISAIPAGDYEVRFTWSKKFGREMLEVRDVPGRAGIRIHSANYWKELEGCIAVAEIRTDGERIMKSLIRKLEGLVRAATLRDEVVEIEIADPVIA